MLISASLVLLMTPGLALFYGGMTGRRQVLNMMMSFGVMAIVPVLYVLWGWSMSYAGAWVTLAYFPLAHMVWGGGLLGDGESSIAAWMFGSTDGEANIAPIDFAGGTVVHISAGTAAPPSPPTA